MFIPKVLEFMTCSVFVCWLQVDGTQSSLHLTDDPQSLLANYIYMLTINPADFDVIVQQVVDQLYLYVDNQTVMSAIVDLIFTQVSQLQSTQPYQR